MSSKKRNIDYFDDDFEVTYTDDLPDVSIDFDDDEYPEDNYYDDDDDDDDDYPHRKKQSSSRNTQRQNAGSRQPVRKKNASTNLASPLQGPVRATTKLVENLTRFILRPAPAVLAAIITLITILAFWTGHSAYGEPASIVDGGNYTLAAYLAVGGILALWELFSFLFALSGFHSGKGRGLTFFILVYIGSYTASVAGSLIPDSLPTILPVIDGVKGGLASFGSLYPMLFPLCVAGLVTCILKNILAD